MWWSALNLVQQIFFCIAVPATVLLIIQIVLMLIGFGDSTDVDASGVDLSGDGEIDATIDTDPGLSLFSLKTLTAFFTIGGWVGFTLGDLQAYISIPSALVAGTAALVGMAFLLRGIMRMQQNGNIEIKDAVGKIGEVYLTIPAKGNGNGKVTITISERFAEYSAIQNGSEPIATGSKIKIVEALDDCLVVEKI